MKVGRLDAVTKLRRGDQLKDFYDKFKEMHDAVRKRHRADVAAVGRLLDAVDAAGVPEAGELGHRLAELRTYKKQRDEALA
jgi:hypothetical protein